MAHWYSESYVAASYAIFSMVLLFILSFHIVKIRFIANNMKRPKKFQVKLCQYFELSHISFLIMSLPLFRCITLGIWHLFPSILNSNICDVFLRVDSSIFFATQGFIHLFIALRSRLNSHDITSSNNIWYKIGLILVLFDFIPIIFIAFGQGFDSNHNVDHDESCCEAINISIILIIFNICSSVLIGLYSLFVFVLPLRKYIKMENNVETNDDNTKSLQQLVQKIILYSTIMIISTVFVAIIVAVAKHLMDFATASDNIINSYCILLQFRDIDTTQIKSNFLKRTVSFLQCSCSLTTEDEVNLEKNMHCTIKIDNESPISLPDSKNKDAVSNPTDTESSDKKQKQGVATENNQNNVDGDESLPTRKQTQSTLTVSN